MSLSRTTSRRTAQSRSSRGSVDVVGVGGFGCVLYPAVVFENAVYKVVNESNRKNFVTKIAIDAEDDYDIGKYVESLVPDAGVYPVDFVCGLSARTLKRPLVKTIEEKCGSIFTEPSKEFFFEADPYRKLLDEIDSAKVELANAKSVLQLFPRDPTILEDVAAAKLYLQQLEERLPSIRRERFGSFRTLSARAAPEGGSARNIWCALQLPKYDSDAKQFSRLQVCSEYSFQELLGALNALFLRLHDLNQNNIFHGDIKAANIAVFYPRFPDQVNLQLKFADWGYTTIFPREWKEYSNNTFGTSSIENVLQSLQANSLITTSIQYQKSALIHPIFHTSIDKLNANVKAAKKKFDEVLSAWFSLENEETRTRRKFAAASKYFGALLTFYTRVDQCALFTFATKFFGCIGIVDATDLLLEQFLQYIQRGTRVAPFS